MATARQASVAVIAAGVDVEPYSQKIENAGIPFVKIRGDLHGHGSTALAYFVLDLYQLYRRVRPEVVHHFTIKPVIFGTLAASFAGVPRIINTISGLGQAFGEANRLTRIFVKLLYRISLHRSTHVFFQNEEDRSLFVANGLVPASKTSVVPGSGVNLQRFQPPSSCGVEHEAEVPVVVMAARMLKSKGVVEFVQAARIVRERFPRTLFLLVGGLDFGNPAAVAKSDLEAWNAAGWVKWLDHVDDIRPLFGRADVVVLPSYYREGVPRSLLEAAAMGKPLVTTDNTGCREVVQHGVNGLIVAPRDTQALADAIMSLIANPQLAKRMGLAGYQIIRQRFDERMIIERTIEAYGLCNS